MSRKTVIICDCCRRDINPDRTIVLTEPVPVALYVGVIHHHAMGGEGTPPAREMDDVCHTCREHLLRSFDEWVTSARNFPPR